MKSKLLFSVIAIIWSICASGQVERGRILVGGSLGVSTEQYKEVIDGRTNYTENTTDLWLSPRLGFFITNSVALGAGINLSSTVKDLDNNDRNSFSSLLFSPFLRIYTPARIFGQIEAGIGASMDNNDPGTDYEYRTFMLSPAIGYAAFLNRNIAIEPMISYNFTTHTDADDSNYKEKLNTLMFQLGFSIYLDRR